MDARIEALPYWYTSESESERGRRVLRALQVYQAADSAMRRRTRTAMRLGENEMLALRLLLKAEREAQSVTPTQIARHLEVSTASMTAMLDRLEASGHVQRTPHPRDRRSVTVTPTPAAHQEVRATLSGLHERMMAATRELTDADASVIVDFLERVTDAVGEGQDQSPDA